MALEILRAFTSVGDLDLSALLDILCRLGRCPRFTGLPCRALPLEQAPFQERGTGWALRCLAA